LVPVRIAGRYFNKNKDLSVTRLPGRRAEPTATAATQDRAAARDGPAAGLPVKTPSSGVAGLVLGFFQSIMAGSTDLAGPGVGQGRKQRQVSKALRRWMFGCQEIEGDSANPGKTGE